jgi:large subunit ribosomal protein L18
MSKQKQNFHRRRNRIRHRLRRQTEVGKGRVRLSVFRSNQNIYAQVIDDTKGVTVVAASSLDKELKAKAGKDIAQAVGKLVAERAVKAGLSEVVFDRSGYLYHGRVKAVADGAREGGLKF